MHQKETSKNSISYLDTITSVDFPIQGNQAKTFGSEAISTFQITLEIA